MRLDNFNNPIFNDIDIFNAIYEGHTLSSELIVDNSTDIEFLCEIADITFTNVNDTLTALSLNDFDTQNQHNWFMPDEYYQLDIEQFCISKCTTDIERMRVLSELTEYKNRNMIQLLQWLKYFVDTCLKHDIVWGVGRGSSVASYVLFLIGTHKINSIKYNLDWQEFLR